MRLFSTISAVALWSSGGWRNIWGGGSNSFEQMYQPPIRADFFYLCGGTTTRCSVATCAATTKAAQVGLRCYVGTTARCSVATCANTTTTVSGAMWRARASVVLPRDIVTTTPSKEIEITSMVGLEDAIDVEACVSTTAVVRGRRRPPLCLPCCQLLVGGERQSVRCICRTTESPSPLPQDHRWSKTSSET